MQHGPGWSGALLVSLITSCAVLLGAYVAIEQGILPVPGASREPKEPPPASVPPLVGMSLEAASELLKARGLTVLVRDEQAHASVPKGSVSAQDPLAGSVLPVRTPVVLTLSSGPSNETTVPELAGRSFDDAVRALQEAGLELGAVTGPTTGERTIERSDPPARSLVPLASRVALTIATPGMPVPKLTGLRFARAKRLLEERGFVLGAVKDRYQNYGDPLVVLGQTPEPGSSAPRGARIDLVRNAPD